MKLLASYDIKAGRNELQVVKDTKIEVRAFKIERVSIVYLPTDREILPFVIYRLGDPYITVKGDYSKTERCIFYLNDCDQPLSFEEFSSMLPTKCPSEAYGHLSLAQRYLNNLEDSRFLIKRRVIRRNQKRRDKVLKHINRANALLAKRSINLTAHIEGRILQLI